LAEAFVKTMKRDYVRVTPLPDARTVMETLRPCGSSTTTAFIRTRPSAIVRPASSSQIKPNPDRVRSLGENNTIELIHLHRSAEIIQQSQVRMRCGGAVALTRHRGRSTD
jgi:hypothetical protein